MADSGFNTASAYFIAGEAAVAGPDLELLPRLQAERLAERLGRDDPPGGVNGGLHGIYYAEKMPSFRPANNVQKGAYRQVDALRFPEVRSQRAISLYAVTRVAIGETRT